MCENIKHVHKPYDAEVYILQKIHDENHTPWRMGMKNEQSLLEHCWQKYLGQKPWAGRNLEYRSVFYEEV